MAWISPDRRVELLAGLIVAIHFTTAGDVGAQGPGSTAVTAPRAVTAPARPGGGGTVRPGGSFRAAPQPRASPAARSPRFAPQRTPRLVSPPAQRRIQVQPRRTVTPSIQRQLPQRPPRVVVPKGPKVVRPTAPLPGSRVTPARPRTLPAGTTAFNPGLRRNPGSPKPPAVAHSEARRASKAGWQHHHRPFYFKRGGQRWKRIYYSLPLAGLWYWYWYDVLADDDPVALAINLVVLPECAPDLDECIVSGPDMMGELVAPAIVEGRASPEMLDRCAARYRSFDRRTGTFTAYGGGKRICPYLL